VTLVHINRPRGHYVAQVRGRGCRLYRSVDNKEYATPEAALAKAVLAMKESDHRARALFITDDGWYEPHVAMEAHR